VGEDAGAPSNIEVSSVNFPKGRLGFHNLPGMSVMFHQKLEENGSTHSVD
jgi:hypothetical protein